jgi:tungstate transport system substrate-binding protein
MIMRRRILAGRVVMQIVVGALLAATLGCAKTAPRIVLVTTTSVGNSGLLETLLPAYERAANVQFGVHQVGSGLALKMLANGQADIAISHAPDAETAALREHPRWWYRKIMFNDFLIVGPSADPARVRDAQNATDAFRRIAAAGSEFVSRADQSGTHEREQALWHTVGTVPGHLLETGQGMAATLRIAAARQAYTLTDRATWIHFEKSLDLKRLFERERDRWLLNTYAVIVDPDRVEGAQALAFGMWLADGAGRNRIASFPGFSVWPSDSPRGSPNDRP